MRLKRVVAAVLFVLSAPAVFAGVAYRFSTVTTGLGDQRLSGAVEAEGPRMRMSIASGDGASFPAHSLVLADASHVMVFDPAAKTYYDVTFDPLGSIKS